MPAFLGRIDVRRQLSCCVDSRHDRVENLQLDAGLSSISPPTAVTVRLEKIGSDMALAQWARRGEALVDEPSRDALHMEGVMAGQQREFIVRLELAEADSARLVREGRVFIPPLDLGQIRRQASEDFAGRELRHRRRAAHQRTPLRGAQALHAHTDEEREAAECRGGDQENDHQPYRRAEP